MTKRFAKLENILLNTPNEFGRLVFMDKAKEKEWDECDPQVKKKVLNMLDQYTTEMGNKQAIQLLCHAYNELDKRISKLEKDTETQTS